jgi:hypothetical protein
MTGAPVAKTRKHAEGYIRGQVSEASIDLDSKMEVY